MGGADPAARQAPASAEVTSRRFELATIVLGVLVVLVGLSVPMSGWEVAPIVMPICLVRSAVSSSMITGPPRARSALISRPEWAWCGLPRQI